MRRIQTMCNEGLIEGVIKFGHSWAIPADAEKPRDRRLTTCRYINWRKRLPKSEEQTGQTGTYRKDESDD